MVNIGSVSTGMIFRFFTAKYQQADHFLGAKVVGVKGDAAKLTLTSPACTEIGEKIALSRRIEKHWRLIGLVLSSATSCTLANPLLSWATITAGTVLDPIS